jgi:hypothetical protein
VGVVLYVWDWLSVRNSASVHGSVYYTRPPTAVLGHEMEDGRLWSFGTSGCTFLQHGVELVDGQSQAVRNKAACVANYCRARCCVDVICGDVPNLKLYPYCFSQLRQFL